MTPSRKLHKNDKLWGAVAEALVAAYALMSAKGKLSSYRPFTDVDGKDLQDGKGAGRGGHTPIPGGR